MSDSTDERSLFLRRPVFSTAVIVGWVAVPVAVIMAMVGAPIWAILGAVVLLAAFGAYLAYRTIKHPDNPGGVLKFLQDMSSGLPWG